MPAGYEVSGQPLGPSEGACWGRGAHNADGDGREGKRVANDAADAEGRPLVAIAGFHFMQRGSGAVRGHVLLKALLRGPESAEERERGHEWGREAGLSDCRDEKLAWERRVLCRDG